MTLQNPQLRPPVSVQGTYDVPQGWRIDTAPFPNEAGTPEGKSWGSIEPEGYRVQFGTAPFMVMFSQPVTLEPGLYRVGFQYRPDISPYEIDGDQLAYNEDFFYRLVIEGDSLCASDTVDGECWVMDIVDTEWVNDYPSTGFDDHSHKAQTLHFRRFIRVDTEQPVKLAFMTGSKWGRSSGSLYVHQAYVTKVGDAAPQGCNLLARLIEWIRGLLTWQR